MTREELLKIAKPILFNTDMVRATLDGRKTATRRVVKFVSGRNPNWTGYIKDGMVLYNGTNEPCNKSCQYQRGDILYVRETWCWCPCWDCGMNTVEGCCDETADKFYNPKKGEMGCYGYKASFEDNEQPFDKWYSPRFMPKEAARIFLKVKDIRVERLQDIDDKGAYEEGAGEKDTIYYIGGRVCDFAKIWNSTIKKTDLDLYGWDANPWVWVIEFERKMV